MSEGTDHDVVNRLQELLEQSVVAWDEVNGCSLNEIPKDEQETVLANIISKNPPQEVIEKWFQAWANEVDHNTLDGGWSNRLYKALAKTNVDSEIMKRYFEILQKSRLAGSTRRRSSDTMQWRKCQLVTKELHPTKVQYLISFLDSYYPSRDVRPWVFSLLIGEGRYGRRSSPLWDSCDQAAWDRLEAIVNGFDQSEGTPVLEKYLKTLVETYRCTTTWGSSSKILDRALNLSMWASHLKLVATFSPHLFLYRSKLTGDTFLNHILLTYSVSAVDFFHTYINKLIQVVMEHCTVSAFIPNHQGQTPLGHFIRNLVIPGGPHQRSSLCGTYLSSCLYVAENRLVVVSTQQTINQPPFLQFVGELVSFLVSLLTTSEELSEIMVGRITTLVEVFINTITDDCCNTIVDNSGNTALHIAIAKSRQRDRKWSQALVHQLLTRLMTKQATLARNRDGKLPMDLALEREKEPWIGRALSLVAPKQLEYRNPASKLYPFQVMALLMRAPGASILDNLSTCYSFLQMAPYLVTTALTEENTAFLMRTNFIEGSRLLLEVERAYRLGLRRAKDLQRMALEEHEGINP